MKQRIEFFDIAKGIAMLAVIWGHFLYLPSLMIERVFDVELFFFVSGYFISKKKTRWQFTKEKAKQLLKPYIITGIVLIICSFFYELIRRNGIESGVLQVIKYTKAFLYGSGLPQVNGTYHIDYIGPIWYLLALFFGIVIVKFFAQYKWGFLGIFATICIGVLTAKICWWPLSIQSGMAASGYIYIGYLCHAMNSYFAEKIQKKENSKKTATLVTVVEIFAMILFLMITIWYLHTAKEIILCAQNTYDNGWIDGVGSVSAVMFVLLFSKIIVSHIPLVKDFLFFFGKNTLLIMCVHTIDTVVISWMFLLSIPNLTKLQALEFGFVCKVILYSIFVIVWSQCKKIIKDKCKKKEVTG